MTENYALAFYDLVQNRLMGWDIVMAMDPKKGRIDGRTRRSKEVGELQRDLTFNSPRFDAMFECIQAGGEVAELWPEALRETVRFRIDHLVPREFNEPTSAYSVAQRKEYGGEEYPDWLLNHGEPGTIDDHPPIPEKSDRYNAWKASAGLPHIFGGDA